MRGSGVQFRSVTSDIVLLIVCAILSLCVFAVIYLSMLAARQMQESHDRQMRTLAGTLSDSTIQIASGISKAMAASMVPPERTVSREELVANAAHDMAADWSAAMFAEDDDTDPTDHLIRRDRTEVSFGPSDGDGPFGIPGLGPVPHPELDL